MYRSPRDQWSAPLAYSRNLHDIPGFLWFAHLRKSSVVPYAWEFWNPPTTPFPTWIGWVLFLFEPCVWQLAIGSYGPCSCHAIRMSNANCRWTFTGFCMRSAPISQLLQNTVKTIQDRKKRKKEGKIIGHVPQALKSLWLHLQGKQAIGKFSSFFV